MLILFFLAIIIGLILLVWSADTFITGAAAVATHYKISPLFIGMTIVGFGTSLPEMLVSAVAAYQGSPGLALGNAYGSNIANIGLVIGLTALISPIHVHSKIVRKELPILMLITAITIGLLWNGQLTRLDSIGLLLLFAGLLFWNSWESLRKPEDSFGIEMAKELSAHAISMQKAVIKLIIGIVVLSISSRMLVWGAISVAQFFKVSDVLIGLTIVAIGTSLPELASSIVAARKNEHDLALGNIIGSNLFNTLVVVGIAGVISPTALKPEILMRDIPVMSMFTIFLFLFSYGFSRPGRINRIEGAVLLVLYILYLGYLVVTAF